jgi:hypothetical protein
MALEHYLGSTCSSRQLSDACYGVHPPIHVRPASLEASSHCEACQPYPSRPYPLLSLPPQRYGGSALSSSSMTHARLLHPTLVICGRPLRLLPLLPGPMPPCLLPLLQASVRLAPFQAIPGQNCSDVM